FCGLRTATKEAKLDSLTTSNIAVLDHYLDPLPCNCCAAWFCPAGTGKGYPEFAYREGAEMGYYNLSIFFYGCSFDCLFCQNYHHKNISRTKQVDIAKLVNVFRNNSRVSCVCFFGGSPEPQFPFALKLSKHLLEAAKETNRIMRICWEWNGYGSPRLIRKAAQYSIESGGNIKFDLKAFNPSIHKALTGVDNTKVLENFKMVGEEFFSQRPDLPVLNATTLLVPGYVDEVEIENLASFIASIDENIPYSLLAFHPQFEFFDLGYTSAQFAERCYRIASKYLKNVNIGNKHILR
ncbi:MAG: radical SAM protein, partial [Candidatus Heimdallarchaeaceae archaeon]